jgi:hypothetical protein
MQTLTAKILSVLPARPQRRMGNSGDPQVDGPPQSWRLRVAYPGPQTVYEIELHEPLRSFASQKYTVGLNGTVEFEMLSNPNVAAGDRILINAFEPGEKILG